jgi:NO-binding membrane sensor protein with MHYT domain
MIKLYTCIQSEHYLPLTVLAGLICLFGSLIAVNLFDRFLRSRSSRFDWVVISGLVGGTTIWSTHFIAMLAYCMRIAEISKVSSQKSPRASPSCWCVTMQRPA